MSTESWKLIEEHGIVSYNYGQKITRGQRNKISAHHLVPQVHATALSQNKRQMFCIILTKGDHDAVTQWWRKRQEEFGAGARPREMTKEQVRTAFREVYKDYPEILKLEWLLFKSKE